MVLSALGFGLDTGSGKHLQPVVRPQYQFSSIDPVTVMSRPKSQKIYKVLFVNQGRVFEIYARHIAQGALYGFVEVEDLVFGEKTSLVVDPSEERLRNEFSGVKRLFLPMHALIRIDEVEKEGVSKIRAGEEAGNVTPFPQPLYGPPRGGSQD